MFGIQTIWCLSTKYNWRNGTTRWSTCCVGNWNSWSCCWKWRTSEYTRCLSGLLYATCIHTHIHFNRTRSHSITFDSISQDARFNREIDLQTGYRTKALLCMPIKDASGDVVGVAQVINKLNYERFTENDEKVSWEKKAYFCREWERRFFFSIQFNFRKFHLLFIYRYLLRIYNFAVLA